MLFEFRLFVIPREAPVTSATLPSKDLFPPAARLVVGVRTCSGLVAMLVMGIECYSITVRRESGRLWNRVRW
jgi:hypothetical protein